MKDFSEATDLDLTGCAIAVFENAGELDAASQALEQQGYDYYVLEGESGQQSLQAKQDGIGGIFERIAAAFGDELRIIDRLDRSLADGHRVVIVKAEDKQEEVVQMLTEQGGRFLWQFRDWTFNPAGSAEEKETGEPDTAAEEDGS